MFKTTIEYIDHHTTGSIGVSLASFGLSYLDIEVIDMYEILVEILRFCILLFGSMTAILTFYTKFIKKNKDGKRESSKSNNKEIR